MPEDGPLQPPAPAGNGGGPRFAKAGDGDLIDVLYQADRETTA